MNMKAIAIFAGAGKTLFYKIATAPRMKEMDLFGKVFPRDGRQLWKTMEKKQAARDEVMRNVEFINKYTGKGEPILILPSQPYQGIYLSESKRPSSFNPGFTEMFFKKDYERLLHVLKEQKIDKIFIESLEPSIYEPLFFSFKKDLLPILEEGYQKIDDNGSMSFLMSKSFRKVSPPSRPTYPQRARE